MARGRVPMALREEVRAMAGLLIRSSVRGGSVRGRSPPTSSVRAGVGVWLSGVVVTVWNWSVLLSSERSFKRTPMRAVTTCTSPSSNACVPATARCEASTSFVIDVDVHALTAALFCCGLLLLLLVTEPVRRLLPPVEDDSRDRSVACRCAGADVGDSGHGMWIDGLGRAST